MAQLMTLDEKIALIDAADAAEEAGNMELSDTILRKIPLEPYLAQSLLERDGLESVLSRGFNLSEVEAQYGEQWLKQYRRGA